MHNINYIRDNPVEFDNFMKTRGEKPIANKIIDIDKEKRETQTVLQNLLSERNFNIVHKEEGTTRDWHKDLIKGTDSYLFDTPGILINQKKLDFFESSSNEVFNYNINYFINLKSLCKSFIIILIRVSIIINSVKIR